MRVSFATCLALLITAGTQVCSAGIVTGTVTFSATGQGGGYYSDRSLPGGNKWFQSNDIVVSASYTYDPTIQGVNGVFYVPTLVLSVFIPPGWPPIGFTVYPLFTSTVAITKNEIDFSAGDMNANMGIWVDNPGGGIFSPDSLPQSLDALNGQRGGFSANYFNHDPELIEGTLGIVPEPTSIITLAIGIVMLPIMIITATTILKLHRRSRTATGRVFRAQGYKGIT
jgi:hypothetical protein